MGGTRRHKEVILWSFFWAHVQFLKIPFDPPRSQQLTLVNITLKVAVPRAVLGAGASHVPSYRQVLSPGLELEAS